MEEKNDLSVHYSVELSESEFSLLLKVLRKAQVAGLVAWGASDFVCEHTKLSYC